MIDPVVRPRVSTDRDQLVELERAARDGLAGARGGERWLETHPARRWLDEGDVLVAVIDELVVGYLVLVQAEQVARVDEVYVMPETRELGFGDAMLGAAVERARAAGARLLEGEALPGDRDVKNLYERAGITARLITVSTVL